MGLIFPLAFAVSLFFSPDFLTIFGNGLGVGGIWFLCLLILVLAFHAYTIETYAKFYTNNPESNNEYAVVSSALGNITGFIFPFIVKVLLAIFMGVGLLATAGYAFNELFVRWFPNMGFTLLALGGLLIIGLVGPRLVRICQLTFVGVSISGIVILSTIGLFSSADAFSIPVNFGFDHIDEKHIIFSCFVLLMGFEMINCYENEKLYGRFSSNTMPMAALVFGFIILFVWGVVSLMYVSPERLSGTYIPHLIAARAINGVYGREIMGLVIIFASLGAVNALLSYVSFIGEKVLSRELTVIIDKSRHRTFLFIILVLTIAGMLASGMAGEAEFETFTRGSIYLWLLNYGAIHLAVFVSNRRAGGETAKFLPFRHCGNLISSIFVIGLYFGMVLTDDETVLILKFTSVISVGGLLIYLFYRYIIMKLIYKDP